MGWESWATSLLRRLSRGLADQGDPVGGLRGLEVGPDDEERRRREEDDVRRGLRRRREDGGRIWRWFAAASDAEGSRGAGSGDILGVRVERVGEGTIALWTSATWLGPEMGECVHCRICRSWELGEVSPGTTKVGRGVEGTLDSRRAGRGRGA